MNIDCHVCRQPVGDNPVIFLVGVQKEKVHICRQCKKTLTITVTSRLGSTTEPAAT
jgi:hypothetical protein